jgi:hypothetical protein
MERAQSPSRDWSETYVRLPACSFATPNADARNYGAVMRLFKPLEHLQAALKAIQSSGTPLEQWTAIGRQLSYAGYLSFDALVWVRPSPFHTRILSTHSVYVIRMRRPNK